jgi:hypothetical protein
VRAKDSKSDSLSPMPLWLIIALGAGVVWLLTQGQAQAAQVAASLPSSSFSVGQIINVAAGTQMYSDAGLTQNVGSWPGGTATVTVVGPSSLGFVGPSGAGLGGGAPAYIPLSAAS